MRRRSQLIPWKVAGRVSERHLSGDDVVRETGWVFNNEIGDDLTLAEFVATGDDEVPAYLEAFGLREDANAERTMIEIGSGIGRMTVAFTREFGSVIAADLDIEVRIASIDGGGFPMTMDYRDDRVNIDIEADTVVRVLPG